MKKKLQKELQKYCFFIDKKSNIKSKILKLLPGPGFEPRTSPTSVWCVTSRQPRQLNLSSKVKLINCFNSMGQNKQTKPNLRATLFQQSRYFSNILTCNDNFIGQFLIFMEVCITAQAWLKVRCKQFWSEDTGIASFHKEKTNYIHTCKLIFVTIALSACYKQFKCQF